MRKPEILNLDRDVLIQKLSRWLDMTGYPQMLIRIIATTARAIPVQFRLLRDSLNIRMENRVEATTIPILFIG